VRRRKQGRITVSPEGRWGDAKLGTHTYFSAGPFICGPLSLEKQVCVPIFGKEITWSRDGHELSFDVTSDSGSDGRQYTKIQLPQGGPVLLEMGMAP